MYPLRQALPRQRRSEKQSMITRSALQDLCHASGSQMEKRYASLFRSSSLL